MTILFPGGMAYKWSVAFGNASIELLESSAAAITCARGRQHLLFLAICG